MEEAIEFTGGGIMCDSCDWHDDNVKDEDVGSYVNKPCPVCGANLLTDKDYQTHLELLSAIETVNSMSEEDLVAFLEKQSPGISKDLASLQDSLSDVELSGTIHVKDGIKILLDSIKQS